MASFKYTAVNTQGKQQSGILDGENEKHIRQQLKEKQLFALDIQRLEKKSSEGKKISFFRSHALSARGLALFTRQFSTLLAAGLPVVEALFAISEQMENANTRHLVLSVRNKIIEGNTLASAMKEFPSAFPHLYCASVAAGERSGYLDKVLTRLADYTEQQARMRQKLISAMIYPAMIVLVAVGIVSFLLAYVVPKMVSVYGKFHQTLPVLTQGLIALSHGIQKYGFYFLMACIILIWIFKKMWNQSEIIRTTVQTALLGVPLIGKLIRMSNTARFSRTLAILSSSGVPVLEALNISAELVTVIPIRSAILIATSRVREGVSIFQALKQTRYFTPMSLHMIASGEASGQLEAMLDRVAIQEEEDIVQVIEVGLSLFEPAVILLMGGVILMIVLAVLLPIFNLNDFAGS